jgi:RNA polymerase sigma-70 factor, ECF subfamily
MAFLVLLESLSPVEPAVFLLREVFGYGFGEIAEIVGKSEANCRQLLVRARRHVAERKPRFEASRAQRQELADRFSPPPPRATRTRSWSCSPPTSCSTATEAG